MRHSRCVYCAASLKNPNPAEPAKAEPKVVEAIEEPRTLGGTRPRFQRQSSDKVHVLVGGAHEPIDLSPGKLFVLGRDPRASLVIHLTDISRQHAEIDWQGEKDDPRPVLNEIRSRNGTFLNGKRLVAGEPLPLRSGDEIRLGEAFRLRYLHLTPRDLRLELQEEGESDTRAFRVASGAAAAPAATAVEGHSSDAADVVAAAMGETELSSLDSEGDFTRYQGRHLVKRLYAQRRSGVLTVFDGQDIGEMVLIEGRCRHALLGVRSGREALEYVACLTKGRYRFRAEDPDELAAAPPPSDVDEEGLALSGDLQTLSGSDLVRDLVSRKVTGVVTVFDDTMSGQLVLEVGLCQEVAFGTQRDREALDSIVRMQYGKYRFRPIEERLAPQRTPAPPIEDRRTQAFQRQAGSGLMRSPSIRLPDDEEGVYRRSTQPVRPPRLTRRQRPPLPRKQRRPPPPPRY